MSSWFNWVTGKRVAPERVPTDTVLPLHWMDDTKTNRSLVLDFTMRFDDVMDAGKLVNALETLLEKPGWRKLGARLRLNANGKLEYHVPEQYTKERPAVAFSHAKHSISINDHPFASRIPRPNGFAQVFPEVENYRPIVLPEDPPTRIEDYYFSDRPQLGLHVVSFEDATIVTLIWPHTFIDAMSQATIFNAWAAVLEGRDEDVPEFFGETKNPLAALGAHVDLDDDDEEEYVLKDKLVSGVKMMKFAFNLAWEIALYRTDESRVLTIPPKLFAKIKAQAFKDLETVDPSSLVMDTRDPSNPKPFLSDGDILCAWCHRLFTSCQPWITYAPPSRIIHIMNIFDMTTLLQTTEPRILPKDAVYVGNCNTAISSLFRLDDLLALPLGVVAAKIRSDLVTQSTRPQMNAFMRINKAAISSTGNPPLFGEADMIIATFTNWAKGKFFQTDFKGAVTKEGTANGKHIVGQPTACSMSGSTTMLSVRNGAPCIGRDNEGNWWCGAVLRTETWANVERKIAELNREIEGN